jgi:hypothetical protein
MGVKNGDADRFTSFAVSPENENSSRRDEIFFSSDGL